MKLQKRKGMSLVEVMMAFVLIGFLVLMVSGAVTSSYKTSAALQELPGLYYEGQQEVENELDELEKKITQKYLYEKELGMEAAPDPALQTELDRIDEELASKCEIVSVTLFGKDVALYRFGKNIENEDSGHFTLYAGTASGVRLERPAPVIGQAVIGLVGVGAVTDLTNAGGQMLSAEVSYAETNLEYRYTELYQWYVSTGEQHAVYYDDGTPGPDESQYGSLMPVFPGDFTPVTSERTSAMTLTDAYRGKFLCCQVTPLSINGKMGESVVSNLIYVSDLPGGFDYRAVIDPSLMVLPYEPSGALQLTILNSTSAASGTFTASGTAPRLMQAGELLSDTGKAYSRYLRFEAADAVKSGAGLTAKRNDRVFAVVRSRDPAGSDFLKVGAGAYGFAHNAAATAASDGWVLLTMQIREDRDVYRLGGGRFDLAELIVCSDPGDAGAETISQYLKNKYSLN